MGNSTSKHPASNEPKNRSDTNLFSDESISSRVNSPTNDTKLSQDDSNEEKDGKCPMKGSGKSFLGSRLAKMNHPKIEKKEEKVQYNVYSQAINPDNMMPVEAIKNQLPSANQREELSRERERSTIPKGGANDGVTWTYPSPQMFYNALSRKDKLGDTSESEMSSVVQVHNIMNERTWTKVLEWESVLSSDEVFDRNNIKLLRFLGRPTDLSPKARFKYYIFGHPLPFDRHDWFIQNSSGERKRYVIDYYYDESESTKNTQNNSNDDFDSIILADVRPAIDSPRSFFGRVAFMPWARHNNETKFVPLQMIPTPQLKSQALESLKVWQLNSGTITEPDENEKKVDKTVSGSYALSDEEAISLTKSFSEALRECKLQSDALNDCSDDNDCMKKSASLSLCMSKFVCPLQHNTLMQCLNQHGSDKEDVGLNVALENMTSCVERRSEEYKYARKNYPNIS